MTLGILPQIRFNLTRFDPSKQSANQTSNSLVSYNKKKRERDSSRSKGSQPNMET